MEPAARLRYDDWPGPDGDYPLRGNPELKNDPEVQVHSYWPYGCWSNHLFELPAMAPQVYYFELDQKINYAELATLVASLKPVGVRLAIGMASSPAVGCLVVLGISTYRNSKMGARDRLCFLCAIGSCPEPTLSYGSPTSYSPELTVAARAQAVGLGFGAIDSP